MKHYSKEELDMYRHGKLSVLGRIACAAHLKQCPECAAKLRELDADDELLRSLRSSLQNFRDVAAPASQSSARQ